MKKIILSILVVVFAFLHSCNNQPVKENTEAISVEDSVAYEVKAAGDDLEKAAEEAAAEVDSIAELIKFRK